MSTSEKGKPLSHEGLRQFVNRALQHGFMRESFHAVDRHDQRNVSDEDVSYALERTDWTLLQEPNYDDNHKTWEYLISSKDVDGDELRIKFAVYSRESRIRILTAY